MKQISQTLVLVFLCCVQSLYAQHNGIVLDPDSIPLEYANVTLLNPQDSTLIVGAVTNKDGYFELNSPAHQVIVRVTYPGYSPYSKYTEVEDMGIIQMKPIQMDEVVVYASASRIISQRVDRLVYNVENDMFSKNKNAMQLLEQTPRISINQRDGSISMVGRNGAKLMIDGRVLSDDESKGFLSSLKAEEIASIEVIPVPPAKYQAEGDIGLVNIKMKKDPSEGIMGNLTLNYQQGIKASSFPSGTLNWHKDVWSVRIGITPRFYNGKQESGESYNYADKSYARNSYADTKLRNYSSNIMIQVKPTKWFELGLITEGGFENNKFRENSVSGYNNSASLISTIMTSTPSNLRFNGSIYGDFSLNNKGSKLTVTYNNRFRRRGINDSFISDNNNIETCFSSLGTYYYRTNSFLADLILPLSVMRFETGYSVQLADNTCGLELVGDNVDKMFGVHKTNYRYDENIYATYLSASAQLGRSVYAKVGLRYEYTSIKGVATGVDDKVSQHYHNLFPSAFVIWNINNNNSISLNYAYRIQRPYFEDLNPFVRYYDINNYHIGNPDLQPAMSHNVELNYSYKGNLNFTLWGNKLNDNINYIPLFLENGTQTQQVINCSNTVKSGITVSYSVNPIEWFSIYAQGSAYYSQSHCYITELNINDMDGWGGNFNIYANLFMNRKKNLRCGISYWQALPSIENLTRTNAAGSLNVDISYSLLQDRLNISVGANDIFNQSINRSERDYTNYKYTNFTNAYQRSVWIGVSWKFGKQTVSNVNIGAKDVVGDRGI